MYDDEAVWMNVIYRVWWWWWGSMYEYDTPGMMMMRQYVWTGYTGYVDDMMMMMMMRQYVWTGYTGYVDDYDDDETVCKIVWHMTFIRIIGLVSCLFKIESCVHINFHINFYIIVNLFLKSYQS